MLGSRVNPLLAALLAGWSAYAQPRALDLDSRPVDPQRLVRDGVVVLVFVRSDCPISNRYAPELNRIFSAYARRGVGFRLVYPDPDESTAAIRQHMKDYGYRWDALRDPEHKLVKLAQVRITPEAAVFSHGREVYRGRIDDRYIDFGRARREATTHDLVEALEAALAGKAVARAETPAVGCSISDLR